MIPNLYSPTGKFTTQFHIHDHAMEQHIQQHIHIHMQHRVKVVIHLERKMDISAHIIGTTKVSMCLLIGTLHKKIHKQEKSCKSMSVENKKEQK